MIATRRPVLVALCAFICAAAVPALAHDGVHIEDPWARFIPGARSGVVYLLIENHAAVEETLLSVSTDLAGMASLHTSSKDADGMMTMDALPAGLTIAPGAIAELQKGGTHIMLMDLTRRPKDGETFTLTLTFAHAGKLTVEVPVDNKR